MALPTPPVMLRPPDRPAFDVHATCDGVEHVRRLGWRCAAVGVGSFAVGVALLTVTNFPSEGVSYWAAILLIALFGMPLIGLGFAGVIGSRSMARRLRREPWTRWDARVAGPDILGVKSAGADERIVVLFSSKRRALRLCVGLSGAVWICGDPTRTCVVSLPGGGEPLLGRRAGRLTRRRLKRGTRA